jgi:hypothetical protein
MIAFFLMKRGLAFSAQNMLQRKAWLPRLLVLLLVVSGSLFTTCRAQVAVLQYKIMVGGGQVGAMQVYRASGNGNTKFTLHCEVRKRVVWLYTVNEDQSAEFQNNKLVRSSCLRNVNGKVKVNSSLLYKGAEYEIISHDEIRHEPFPPIANHMLGIYFAEPTHGLKVYSDNFQQFIKIEKIASGEYKIVMPDGNHSTYYYENGVCTRVKSKQTLFTVEMLLDK